MSKNISIKEGGTGRGFTARRLETALEGGGSCLWVPKDEVRRVSKSVDENGTYEAAAEGAYGYSELHVNVKSTGSATGKGPDGNEYTVTVDDLGELTETKVPSSIKITTPPTFVGPYGDGAIIGFDGIEVTAYDAEENRMGAVPFSELVFPVTIARYDPDADTSGGHSSALDTSPVEQPIPEGVSTIYSYPNTSEVRYTIEAFGGAVFITGAPNYSNFWVLVASKTSGGGVRITDHRTGGVETLNANSSFGSAIGDGYLGITNVSTSGSIYFFREGLIRTSVPVTNQVNIAATILYGDVVKPGSQQSIPVQWPRPGDGKILADTFDITVVDVSPSTNDDESGNGWTL